MSNAIKQSGAYLEIVSFHLGEQEFRKQFAYLVAHEPPPLAVDEHGELAASES